MIVKLDAEKAFNNVNLMWLFEVMERLFFRPNYALVGGDALETMCTSFDSGKYIGSRRST